MPSKSSRSKRRRAVITAILDGREPPPKFDPQLLQIDDAAYYLEMPVPELRQLAHDNIIPYTKRNGALLFHMDDLDEFLASEED